MLEKVANKAKSPLSNSRNKPHLDFISLDMQKWGYSVTDFKSNRLKKCWLGRPGIGFGKEIFWKLKVDPKGSIRGYG